jgi:hypothetical protein
MVSTRTMVVYWLCDTELESGKSTAIPSMLEERIGDFWHQSGVDQ